MGLAFKKNSSAEMRFTKTKSFAIKISARRENCGIQVWRISAQDCNPRLMGKINK
jgi:hypothetical protein